MKDVFGRPVELGCEVAFALGGTHEFRTGHVIKINPKTVTIRYAWVSRYGGPERFVTATRRPEFVAVRS